MVSKGNQEESHPFWDPLQKTHLFSQQANAFRLKFSRAQSRSDGEVGGTWFAFRWAREPAVQSFRAIGKQQTAQQFKSGGESHRRMLDGELLSFYDLFWMYPNENGLRADSPFASPLLLFRNHSFSRVSPHLLKTQIPEQKGQGTATNRGKSRFDKFHRSVQSALSLVAL